MSRSSFTLVAALAALSVALLAGCGEKTVEADSAADSVAGLVVEQTGFEPDDMSCPDDVKAEVGATFVCTFTGPDADYVADVEITAVEGDSAEFQVETKPVGE